jgi:phage repressor protein C with HTH and peptisase S24 domain
MAIVTAPHHTYSAQIGPKYAQINNNLTDMRCFGDRLEHVLEQDPRRQKSIADSVGMTSETIRVWKKRDDPPDVQNRGDTRSNFYGLAEELKVNPDWLLTGDGDMRPNGVPEDVQNESFENEDGLVLYSLSGSEPRGSAGPGAHIEPYQLEEDDVIVRSTQEIRQLTGHNPSKLRPVKVEGNSMEPKIKAGTRALYLPMETIQEPGIYYLRLGSRWLIKQVNVLAGGVLRLYSANSEEYPDKETLIPLEDANTDNMYRVEETDVTAQVDVEGRIVIYCSVT